MLLLPLLVGCEPSCEQVCDKVVECESDGTERMSAAECKEQCSQQELRYATWDDTQLRDAFDAEKSCLYDSTCEEVAAGVCYDEAIWSF